MGGKMGSESYALVLDGESVFVSYSKIQCITAAGKLMKAGRAGKRLHLVKVEPVQSHKDAIVFAWQNNGAAWRVQPLSEAS